MRTHTTLTVWDNVLKDELEITFFNHTAEEAIVAYEEDGGNWLFGKILKTQEFQTEWWIEKAWRWICGQF